MMRVLILTPHYLPGFRAGGPVRSVSNLVERLSDDHEFRIVTANHDHGDATPYRDVDHEGWSRIGKAQVGYFAGGMERDLRRLRDCYQEWRPDLIYINGLFNRRFGLTPLAARRMGLFDRTPLLVAPRGELNPSALASKSWKKSPVLALVKSLRLLDGVTLHATSAGEAEDIRRAFGEETRVSMAPNLASLGESPDAAPRPKTPGEARLAYLARVIPNKNLLWGLDRLADVRGAVSLDIWGPAEDRAYAQRCEERIRQLPAGIRVNWCGQLDADAAPGTLAHYDGLLLPTRWENFGHAIVEAMGAGCPPLISDRTPWRELRKRGVGWDTSLTEPEAYTQAIQELCDLDETAHAAMRERCQELAESIVMEAEQDMRSTLQIAAAA